MKKGICCLLTLLMLLSALSACAGQPQQDTQEPETQETETVQPEAQPQAEDEENYETGDAALDDPLNQDGIGEQELLIVSFGTSYNDSRRLTIGAIEQRMIQAFPDWSVRRAFTSQIIIDHIQSRDGIAIDNVDQALERAMNNGVKKLVVQPTHLMNGIEYNELVDTLAKYSDAFESVAVGEPLLTSDSDFATVAEAIVAATGEYSDPETAVCFMGHGTEADSNQVYAKMQQVLTDGGYEHYFIGTVEATPTVEDVLAMVQQGGYKRVVLQPLMIVAGDHANNDMAGDDDDSWKSVFEGAGYDVECLVRGLGEMEQIQDLLVAHAQAAVESTKVAGAEDMAAPVDVLDEDLQPVPASSLKDGTYPIKVDSSSSMFKIESCALTVADGEMNASMTMSGTGYLYLYMGTAQQAAAAPESDYIPFEEGADGVHTFTVPVSTLDQGIDCAAFSKRKELWYDRTLVFRADSLPLEAFADGQVTTPESLALADGTYLVDVSLEGGSGRAGVTSPTKLTVAQGAYTATIEWSSPNYDYMVADEQKYLPVTEEGNSVFEIPVTGFDCKLTVRADTTAMSTPHEIEYTLYFDSSSIQPAQP